MENRKVAVTFAMTCLLLRSALKTVQAEVGGPFRKMFPPVLKNIAHSINDTGEPLFLSPYIEKGEWQRAQFLSFVQPKTWGPMAENVDSYSGYLTVGTEACHSNLFFWYFPAEHNAKDAPVLLWLQGGPGGSSLFGLFNENGPFQVKENLKVTKRQTSWTLTHHVIYIDQPVGTGFSFTKLDKCMAQNQDNVATDLYNALRQFFIMFPDIKNNEFYITGESYAGKYVPALAHKIHTLNPLASEKINLKGMAIGDGLCDPINMIDYGDFLFNIGLLDELDRNYFNLVQHDIKEYIKQEKYGDAFRIFDELLNGDTTTTSSYYSNVTGFTWYFNYLLKDGPKDLDYYTHLVEKDYVRKAIHVGNLTYNDGAKVEQFLFNDVMKSVKPWVEEIIESGYKVMIYNGQLDVIVAWPLTEKFLTTLDWSAAHNLTGTMRTQWHVGDDLAGYVKEVGDFTQVLVRNAGHMVPYDQPKWSFDLINRWTSGKKFN